jgi:hypothetical protein
VINGRLPEPSDVGSDEPWNTAVEMGRGSNVSENTAGQTSISASRSRRSSILHFQRSLLPNCLTVASQSTWEDWCWIEVDKTGHGDCHGAISGRGES